MQSTKELILQYSRRLEPVEIEGLGVLHIRHINLVDLDAISAIDDKRTSTYELVLRGVCEPDGSPVFASHSEIEAIDWQLVRRLGEEVARVNGMREVDAKNSPPTPDSSSSSASAPSSAEA